MWIDLNSGVGCGPSMLPNHLAMTVVVDIPYSKKRTRIQARVRYF